MRRYQTDYRLWALLTAGAWGGLLAADYWATGHVFGGQPARLIPGRPDGILVIDVCNALCMVIPAAAVGWLAHARAVVCGVRLSDHQAPPLAADYDDAPPPPSPG
jgi:hypothetical protein